MVLLFILAIAPLAQAQSPIHQSLICDQDAKQGERVGLVFRLEDSKISFTNYGYKEPGKATPRQRTYFNDDGTPFQAATQTIDSEVDIVLPSGGGAIEVQTERFRAYVRGNSPITSKKHINGMKLEISPPRGQEIRAVASMIGSDAITTYDLKCRASSGATLAAIWKVLEAAARLEAAATTGADPGAVPSDSAQ